MSSVQPRHHTSLRLALSTGFALAAIGALAIPAALAQSQATITRPVANTASEFDAPSGLAFGGGDLWVTNLAGNSVTEINPSNGALVSTFSGSAYQFDQPTAIVSSGPDLFVANAGGDSVTELLASNGSVVQVISGSQFDFTDPVALEATGNAIVVLSAGKPKAVPPVAASITEIDATTGALLLTKSGAKFDLDDPLALTALDEDMFVADKGNNSVTEMNIATGKLVRVITGHGLSSPDGIASGDGHVWAVDAATSAVTEIDSSTGQVLGTYGNSDGDYGFGSPSVAIEQGRSVFIASPFGTSPMVTKVSATAGADWYMCNTNGPYYFSLISAFAISGKDLWVASSSGANNPTTGAATGSLTEMSTSTGALITTLPQP